MGIGNKQLKETVARQSADLIQNETCVKDLVQNVSCMK